jgi:hypothetical protein
MGFAPPETMNSGLVFRREFDKVLQKKVILVRTLGVGVEITKLIYIRSFPDFVKENPF